MEPAGAREPEEERERKAVGLPWLGGAAAAPAERGLRALSESRPALLALFAAAALLGAAGIAALRGRRAPAAPTDVFAVAPPPEPGIVIRKPRDRSLNYLSRANEGEIVFEDRAGRSAPLADNAPPEPARRPPGPAAGAPAPAAQGRGEAVGAVSGAAPGAPVDGGSGGPAPAQAPRLKPLASAFQLQLPKLELPSSFKPLARSAAKPADRPVRASPRELTVTPVLSRGSMRQLKVASAFSRSAMKGSEEAASHASANAFEQARSEGGEFSPVMPGAPQVVVPIGSGAPGESGPSTVPRVGPIQDTTPYQPYVDAARNMTQSSSWLRWAAVAVLGAGAALTAAAMVLLRSRFTSWMAWGLLSAGMALASTGSLLMSMSRNLATQAVQMGQTIAQYFQQTDQAAIVTRAADGALKGVPVLPLATPAQSLTEGDVRRAVDGLQQ